MYDNVIRTQDRIVMVRGIMHEIHSSLDKREMPIRIDCSEHIITQFLEHVPHSYDELFPWVVVDAVKAVSRLVADRDVSINAHIKLRRSVVFNIIPLSDIAIMVANLRKAVTAPPADGENVTMVPYDAIFARTKGDRLYLVRDLPEVCQRVSQLIFEEACILKKNTECIAVFQVQPDVVQFSVSVVSMVLY